MKFYQRFLIASAAFLFFSEYAFSSHLVPTLWREIRKTLPQSLSKALPADLTVELVNTSFSAKTDFCTAPTDYRGGRYSTFDSKRHVIEISREWLTKIENCGPEISQKQVRHLLFYYIARAYDSHIYQDPRLIKEFQVCEKAEENPNGLLRTPLANCLETVRRVRAKSFLGASDQYLHASEWKPGFIHFRTSNTQQPRAIEPFEYESLHHHLAVNLAYFILDPSYYCRKPILGRFFEQTFRWRHSASQCSDKLTSLMLREGRLEFAQIDLNRIYRIDYLLASKGDGGMSSWGHSMFRIVMCGPATSLVDATPFGPDCIKDEASHIVFSFRGLVDDLFTSLVKGVTGQYRSKLFAMPFSEIKAEYNTDEWRELIAYPLKLTQEQKQLFVLRALEVYWSYGGKYKFFSNNCATESLNLVRFVHDGRRSLKNAITPYGVLDSLNQANLIDNSQATTTYPADQNVTLQLYREMVGDFKINEKSLREYLFHASAENHLQLYQKRPQQSALPSQNLARASQFLYLEEATLRIWQRAMVTKAIEWTKKQGAKTKSAITDFINLLDPYSIVKEGYGIPQPADLTIDFSQLFAIAKDAEKVKNDSIEAEKDIEALWRQIQGFKDNIQFFENERAVFSQAAAK